MRRYPQRAKEKPQQGGRRGEFTFRIKPHSCQRRSEGSNKSYAHQDLGTPQRLRTVSERLLWRHGSAVVWRRDRGSGCGYGIILLEEVAINPTLELPELT